MARANAAPSGWHPVNEDRAKWAMGELVVFKGLSTSTTEMTVTGITTTDYLCGVINLSTVAAAQPNLNSVAITADKLTLSGSTWTNANHFMVLVWRRQS